MKQVFFFYFYADILKFLSYYPLKQGLKHQSFKNCHWCDKKFLSYYPLKQGLKHFHYHTPEKTLIIFILLSIKTRIETWWFWWCGISIPWIFILLSIKTRIETYSCWETQDGKISIFILLSIKTRIETYFHHHITILTA